MAILASVITVGAFRSTGDQYLTRKEGETNFDQRWGDAATPGDNSAMRRTAALDRLSQLKGMRGDQVLRRNKNGEYMGRSTMFNTTKGALRAFVNDMYAAFGADKNRTSFEDEILRSLFKVDGQEGNLDDARNLDLGSINIAKCKAVMRKFEEPSSFSEVDKHQIDNAIEELGEISKMDVRFDEAPKNGSSGGNNIEKKGMPRSVFTRYVSPRKAEKNAAGLSPEERAESAALDARRNKAVDILMNIIVKKSRAALAETIRKDGDTGNRCLYIHSNLKSITLSYGKFAMFMKANTESKRKMVTNPAASYFYQELSKRLNKVAGKEDSPFLAPGSIAGAFFEPEVERFNPAMHTYPS